MICSRVFHEFSHGVVSTHTHTQTRSAREIRFFLLHFLHSIVRVCVYKSSALPGCIFPVRCPLHCLCVCVLRVLSSTFHTARRTKNHLSSRARPCEFQERLEFLAQNVCSITRQGRQARCCRFPFSPHSGKTFFHLS